MNDIAYLALNAWLQKADGNYVAGRLLWLNQLVDGACNLLWLSAEQIIKILIIQNNIAEYSAQCPSLDLLHCRMEKEGKKLGHDTPKLLGRIGVEHCDLDISKFESALRKLQEYFHRRYVVNSGSSISLGMLNEVDEFYFLLRSKVHPDVGLGTIDEIHIQRKHGWGHPLPAFAFAYMHNNYFRPRRHRPINQMGADGILRVESGL
jgi:hypothetical protein